MMYARIGSKEYNYLADNIFAKRNLNLLRLDALNMSGEKKELQIALFDRENSAWTKWKTYYHNDFNLLSALDIHRSLLWNEIIVESDYPTFEENYQAARIMGAVLEDKGFSPLYYYSGNKSIHISIFMDFKSLCTINPHLQALIMTEYTRSKFIKEFMTFLRLKMAKCWGVNARVADEQVAGSSNHLIRSELSLNKLGFKTFIGYTYKDLSWIPPIYDFNTKYLPRIGDLRLSKPKKAVVEDLITEFLEGKVLAAKKAKTTRKIQTLTNWLNEKPMQAGDLRKCVKLILNPDSRLKIDGHNRGFFILFNELKKVYDQERARALIDEWNQGLGEPIRQLDIDSRAGTPVYKLSCKYIHNFLGSCGYKEEEYRH
jgi:hypothetical protein